MRMRVWSLCDRCGQKYYSHRLKAESTGILACPPCYDGQFDIKRHPQNKPFRARREPRFVPDGRPQLILDNYLALETGGYLLQETGEPLIVTQQVWTPAMSQGQ